IWVTINEQEASPTKDILPSLACSELSVISQLSASTIETYSNEENYIGPVDPNLNETKFQPSNANFTLLYEKLCNAIILADRKTQEAIMCYCLFGKALIQRHNEIALEKQVDPESNIVSRILNKEIKTQLPTDTSDSLLCKRIKKAKKLYKLFDAIDMDKIYCIHSVSADTFKLSYIVMRKILSI
ncbi:7867_t:CDS:2, partial [Dentiscutata heterogama]